MAEAIIDDPAPRLLLYALGGGLGHLQRATALGRAAARLGHAVHLLTNSPFASFLPIEPELGRAGAVTRLPPDRDPARVVPKIRRIVTETDYDALVVDTFPRGLAGELADLLPALGAAKFWTQRDIDPRYAKAADLASLAGEFDVVFFPGEAGPVAPPAPAAAVHTAPWLVRRADELLATGAARRVLGAPDSDSPLVAVVGCGGPAEIAEGAAVAASLTSELGARALVRTASPEGDRARADAGHWPLLEALPGVDVLVGAGGYNTVYEARATDTPLVALARPRRYDRQTRRLRDGERAKTKREVIAKVACHLGQIPAGGAPPRAFPDGAGEAARVIDETLRARWRRGGARRKAPQLGRDHSSTPR